MKKLLTVSLIFSLPFLLNSQIYYDYIGAGHSEGVVVSSSSGATANAKTMDGSGVDKDLAGASRFLSHATLGASIDDILYADSVGFQAWLDEQFAKPRTEYLTELGPINDIVYDIYLQLGGVAEQYFISDQVFRFTWSHIAQTKEDVLRHRIALALSEILVISTNSDLSVRGEGVASYYDVLSEHAFGNYQDLLMDVTLHPTMGFYLSHYNNARSNPFNNTQPDENYAREIMQLFTIGLFELNQDGTRKLDNNGNFIPTYDNNDIKELAKVFTGLGMGAYYGGDSTNTVFGVPFFVSDPTKPMKMYPIFHEPGEKTIVGDFTIPAGQSGMEDIEMAVEHLFNHANTPPFISKLLIKRLVKSNPTPDYVERIADVFVDNGEGVRGDLKAVVEAILMDQEARDCQWIEHPSNGRLKEPIQRYTQFVRGLRAETIDGYFWNQGYVQDYLVNQYPMNSPTVFNFFLPDFQPNADFANENLEGPEFQIYNSATSAGYFNLIYYMTAADYYNEFPEQSLNIANGYEADDFRAYLNIPDLEDINIYPEAVVDYLDMVLAHGNMSQQTRDIIVGSTDPLVAFPDFLVKMALYLTMVSPDYAIMK